MNPKKRILLGLLPFWTPAIPPLGISCLKSSLQKHDYWVHTVDANMVPELRDIYTQYFDITEKLIPEFKRGNFFNIGMDLMRNHLMAHMNKGDNHEDYIELVKIIFYEVFYTGISEKDVMLLSDLLDEFFKRLETYILALVESTRPDVFGLSVFSGCLPASLFAFRIVKQKYPHITTVMGGGTFSMELAKDNPNFERLLLLDYIDVIIIGEGEQLFFKYLEGQLPPKRVYTLSDAPNSSVDLNKAVTPDFSDFDLSKYPQLGAWTSRSCPYQCSFCSETIHWGTYRKKSAAYIADELQSLYKLHGIQIFMMGDSLLNIVVDDLANEIIKRNAPVYWDGYLRTDPPVCDPENTARWRRGGLYRARLGVESGSQNILNIMNKKISVDQIRQSVKSLADAGIKTTTYWIVGHPGETEEDFQMTLDLIEELQDYLWEAECNPFNYYLTGQVNSDKWMSEYKRVTVYPEKYTDMLFTQTWVMENCYPQKPIIFERVNRFVEHCRKLSIPNPYFEKEIFEADMRWKKLHKNAVPALVEFRDPEHIINEKFKIRQAVRTLNKVEIGEFNF